MSIKEAAGSTPSERSYIVAVRFSSIGRWHCIAVNVVAARGWGISRSAGMLLQILSKRSSSRRMPLAAASVCVCVCAAKVSIVPYVGKPSKPKEIEAEVLFCGIPFHSWLQQRRLRVEHVWSNAHEAMVIKEAMITIERRRTKDFVRDRVFASVAGSQLH